MSNKAIVVDANILIRAVLGKRVREIIFRYAVTIKFFCAGSGLRGRPQVFAGLIGETWFEKRTCAQGGR